MDMKMPRNSFKHLVISLSVLVSPYTVASESTCSSSFPPVIFVAIKVLSELCFSAQISEIRTAAMTDLDLAIKANKLEITPLRAGIFTNLFVQFSDGSQQELRLQTISNPVVESIILLEKDGSRIIGSGNKSRM